MGLFAHRSGLLFESGIHDKENIDTKSDCHYRERYLESAYAYIQCSRVAQVASHIPS